MNNPATLFTSVNICKHYTNVNTVYGVNTFNITETKPNNGSNNEIDYIILIHYVINIITPYYSMVHCIFLLCSCQHDPLV